MQGFGGAGDCGGGAQEDTVDVEGECEVWYPLVGGLGGEVAGSDVLWCVRGLELATKHPGRNLTRHGS